MAVRRLLGGLAPDSDQPMAAEMQATLQATWRRIQETIPGTEFNFDFWEHCAPRRSTYPANRAVIAARAQNEACDDLMTGRIQRAYYLEARNPSDDDTLVALAAELGLDPERFRADLVSSTTQLALLEEIGASRAMGMNSFPSLAVLSDGVIRHVSLNYNDADAMQREILAG